MQIFQDKEFGLPNYSCGCLNYYTFPSTLCIEILLLRIFLSIVKPSKTCIFLHQPHNFKYALVSDLVILSPLFKKTILLTIWLINIEIIVWIMLVSNIQSDYLNILVCASRSLQQLLSLLLIGNLTCLKNIQWISYQMCGCTYGTLVCLSLYE